MSNTAPDAAQPGGKKRLILVGLVFALVAAGFYVYTTKFSGGESKPEPGEVLMLDPIHVNLDNGGYLKVAIALQLSADAGGHGGGPNGAAALDLAIAKFSQADADAVLNKREVLKKSLEKTIIDAYHHDVLGIYYTEYVTQ